MSARPALQRMTRDKLVAAAGDQQDGPCDELIVTANSRSVPYRGKDDAAGPIETLVLRSGRLELDPSGITAGAEGFFP